MSKRQVWVSPQGSGWVRQLSNGPVESHHRLQSQAIQAAVRQAKDEHREVIIQGRDGHIRSKDSYGTESRVHDTEH